MFSIHKIASIPVFWRIHLYPCELDHYQEGIFWFWVKLCVWRRFVELEMRVRFISLWIVNLLNSPIWLDKWYHQTFCQLKSHTRWFLLGSRILKRTQILSLLGFKQTSGLERSWFERIWENNRFERITVADILSVCRKNWHVLKLTQK